MGLGTFLLVQVGRAIIRVRPKELAATLRRFKGSKQIKKPTDAQVDKSQTITGNLGNFNKVDRKIVAKADRARPSIPESLTGTGRGSGQTTIKGIKTGESRRNTVKTVASGIGGSTVGAGGTYMLMKDKDKKKTTKSNTKTYAQMVKEDKEKGKNKVLSRRAPETPPRKPKKLRDKPVEKKFNLKKGGKGSAQQRLKEIEKEKKGKK